MTSGDPLVTVVIPTRARPHLVIRAVRSALAQSLQPIEVVVVVDGPDEASVRALGSVASEALRIVVLPEHVGLGGARTAGIAVARSPWIALLDDDDEWLPSKLEIQLETARRSVHARPVIASRFVDRRDRGEVVLPPRCPAKGEPVSEYIFCRPGLLIPEGSVLPSTMLIPRALLERVAFRHASFAYEGSDWLLRALKCDGAGLEFVPTNEPLVIRHSESTHARMSSTTAWRTSLGWARDNAHMLTPRAHAAFLLTHVSLDARRDMAVSAAWQLVREAFRHGQPTRTSLLAHVVLWLVPERVRFALITRLGAWRKATARHRRPADPPGPATRPA